VTQAQLLANDWDPDAGLDTNESLTISAVSGALHGTAVLQADGSVKFTPQAGYSGGAAEFTYTVTDAQGQSTTAVARLRVGIANQAPTVVGEAIDASQDQTLLIAPSLLLANDGDVDNPHGDLFISGVGAASHGTVSLSGGQISFVPEAGYTGGAWFQYTVSDGAGGATVGTVNLNIQPVFVNQAPEVYGEDIALDEDQIATISAGALLANDMDPNGDALSIVNVASGTPGFAISFDGANIVFTPPLNFNGPASLTYDVSDGRGGLSRGTATVLFNPVNDVPVVNGEQLSGVQDTAYVIDAASLLANDTDVETPTQLSLMAVGNATHGDVALIGGSVVFNPHPGYVGKAEFYYSVRDPQGGEAYGRVDIDLAQGAHVNLPPVVQGQNGPIDNSTYDESGFATGGARFSGRVQASDPDGGTLSFSVGGSPHGHVSVDAAGNWTYASDQVDPYRGADSFTIEIADGQGGMTSVPITVTHDRGFPPVVIDLSGNGLDLLSAEDSGMRLDVDGDGTREQVGWVAPSDGVLVFDANHDGWMGSRLAHSGSERGSGGDSAGYRGSDPDWWIPTQTADAALLEELSFVRYMPTARTDLEGLRAFDTNGDGLLSLDDADWRSFGVFQDRNANGRQDEGELRSLDVWGIESIGLERRGDAHINQGNTVWGVSDVRFQDGHATQAGDVQFAAMPVMTPEMELQAQAIQSARTFIQFSLFASANRDEPPLGFVPSAPEQVNVVSALQPNGTHEDIQFLP
jgi:VCBS repeat-containing protein